MYALYSTFTNTVISNHRTIAAVAAAKQRLDNSLKNGSYMPTTIKKIVKGQVASVTATELDDYCDACDQA